MDFFNGFTYQINYQNYLFDLDMQREHLNQLEQSSDFYGSDFDFFDGDLKVTTTGDFNVIDGLLNYTQEITRRIFTTRGTHPQDSTLGMPWGNYIGKRIDLDFVEADIQLELTREILKDYRTGELVSLTVDLQDSSIAVAFEVYPLFLNDIAKIKIILNKG